MYAGTFRAWFQTKHATGAFGTRLIVDEIKRMAETERSVAYSALAELRLVMKKAGGVIRAVERSDTLAMKCTSFPVTEPEIESVHNVLDRVDS